MKKFEMLDLFLIAMLMVGVFFCFAMLSLHGVGYMTWLSWTFFGCSAWCLVVGWCIVAWNMREEQKMFDIPKMYQMDMDLDMAEAVLRGAKTTVIDTMENVKSKWELHCR